MSSNYAPTGDPEADAQALLAESGGVAPPEQENQVLGGFAGGMAQTGSIWPEWAQNVGVGRPHTVVSSAPLYVAGDEFAWLDAKPLEERIRIQDQLLALGLTSSVIPGEFDDGTLAGMRQLMTLANRSGERVEATIGRLRSLADQGLLNAEGVPEFEPAPRLTPDYASVAQDVKDKFRETLGRDPDLYELQHLASELTGFYALESEAVEELQEIQHGQKTTPGVQPGGTVGAVDPMARFQELFEQKYKHEIDFVEDKAEAVKSREAVEAGVGTLSAMSRRGF